MPSLRLRLPPVDEANLLEAFADVRALTAPGVTRGRCELLPGAMRPVSAWHPGCIGAKGGAAWPHWDPDPTPPFRAVELFRVQDAFYVPSHGVVISSAGEVLRSAFEEAAFLTPDLLALPHVQKLGEETFLDVEAAPSLERAAVSLPWGGIPNYAHFVLDCLPGAALIRETSELDAYPLVFPPLSAWQRRHLELASLPGVELHEPVYRVADLAFTSCMAHFLGTPNLNYRTLRDRQLRSVGAPEGGPVRLYVSRRGHEHRRFRSESELEGRLLEAGFQVIVPEEHTVDEQIRIFQRAEVVVGCQGAGLANVLYCPRDARIVEIKTVRSEGWWLAWICALVGCRWRPYFCEGDPGTDGSVSFDADLEDLLRFAVAVD